MTQLQKFFLSTSILFFFHSLVANNTLQGYSFLCPRSQSTDAARELVGWREFINRGDVCGWYSAFAAMGIYQKSYRPNRIAEYFFGNQTISISGSQNQQRDQNELLADYFGLSPLFTSDVVLDPHLMNSMIDLDWYIGYDAWYFRIHAPFVWAKTKFRLIETIHDTGASTPFPALYMDFVTVNPAALSFAQAITQQLTYGQVQQGLQYGRICCSQEKKGVSDVQMAFGYNFWATDIGHAGFNLRGSIPTGNRSHALFLLEPIVGNCHHAELGIGFTSHVVVWEKDEDKSLAIYADLNATHLFQSKQRRSFDFRNLTSPICCNNNTNFGSRYILAKQFDSAGNYTGTTFPAINQTTLLCKTWFNFELDLAIMLAYSSRAIDIDIGYSPWIRSREHVKICQNFATSFGLKGIQNVAIAPGILSNATQTQTATLNGDYFSNQAADTDVRSPQFATFSELNPESGAAPTAFTHKVFWNVSHAWKHYDYEYWVTPFIGFGGEAEFESLHPRAITEPNKNSVSQWAVWVKGGIAF